MAEKSIYNQTIALAGLFQACGQVRSIANDGTHNQRELHTAIDSIFQLDASDVWGIYGDRFALVRGAKLLTGQLNGQISKRDIHITRHVSALISLERKLMANNQAVSALQHGIAVAKEAFTAQENNYGRAIDDLADVYINVISPLGAKVMVQGEKRFLGDETNAKLIRVFLLAGIRSAVLWRQCGGNQLKFIWNRSKHVKAAQEIGGRA